VPLPLAGQVLVIRDLERGRIKRLRVAGVYQVDGQLHVYIQRLARRRGAASDVAVLQDADLHQVMSSMT